MHVGLLVGDAGGAVLVDERAGDEPVEGERGDVRVQLVGGDGVGQAPAQPGVTLNPPVPQPELTSTFVYGVRPTIGDASGVTSTMPAQLRSRCARANTGNSSTAAAIWRSMMWKAPRWP